MSQRLRGCPGLPRCPESKNGQTAPRLGSPQQCKQVASLVGISSRHLRTVLKRYTGKTPTEQKETNHPQELAGPS
ncbi:MAG: helix-turn-helix transcriptional regulator [bacterium]